MDFENFKEKFMEDIKERLEDAGIDAKITTNTVKKLNESYEAVTITPNDSNLGMNLPVEKFFEAYDDGRPYDEVIDKAMEVIENGINERPDFNIDDLTDHKTRLQEEMQAEHRDSVHYVLVSQTGPAHDRTFTVNVLFNDIVLASGTGKSKKAAEEEAAKNALAKRSV